jgi:small subunit ribosomal protein S18
MATEENNIEEKAPPIEEKKVVEEKAPPTEVKASPAKSAASDKPSGSRPASPEPRRYEPRRDGDDQRRDDRGGGGYRPRGGGPGGGKVYFKKKVCRFCTQNLKVSYKDPESLRRFITERGKILPRRITGTCAKHQRALSREIKRARVLALVPFVKK